MEMVLEEALEVQEDRTLLANKVVDYRTVICPRH